MTPLYFDNAKGGLTSRDGKLLECCCCGEYCCNRFGTGGQNNPTILYSSSSLTNGTGSLIYLFMDDQCKIIFPTFQVNSVYYFEVKIINYQISQFILILYCPDYDPGGRSFTLIPDNINALSLNISCNGYLPAVEGETNFSGGPCDHIFHIQFSCGINSAEAKIWKI
jgi:hypothetical protein